MITTTSSLAQRVVEAYGGEQRLLAADAHRSTLTVGGLLFKWKFGHGFRGLNFRIEAAEPRVRIWPLDQHGTVGVLEGHDVRLESADGRVLKSRPNARSHFGSWNKRLLRWDDLDFVYFAGYANWNYVNFPRLLLREDIVWEQTSEFILEAHFPAHLPTHSEFQRFYINPNTHLLERHDFTLEIVSRFSTAAQVISDYGNWNGVAYATKRRFRSRAGGHPHARVYGPLVVWIDVTQQQHDVGVNCVT